MKRRLPFEIVYEDRDLVAIDKPAGLLSTHTRVQGRQAREAQPTAENILTDYLRKGQLKSRLRAWLVHRLDRDTSGVMVFAKTEALALALRERWNDITEKTYVALVAGAMDTPEGVFESYLMEDADGYKVRSVPPPGKGAPRGGGWAAPKLARTEWRVLSRRGADTLVEVKLKSGRKNQIRVHFSEAGHPVVGDVKYGGRKFRRLCLHSASLALLNPVTGRQHLFVSRNAGAPPF